MEEERLIEEIKRKAIRADTATECLETIELLGELGLKRGKYAIPAVRALTEIARLSVTVTESTTAMETAKKIIKEAL